MTDRLKRSLRVLVIAGVSLVLLYLVGANVFLAVGLRRILTKPRMALGYSSAWTVWPGRVHVRGFRIASQTDTVEWALSCSKATVDLDLLELRRREVHFTNVVAEGLSFRFRLRVMPNEADDPQLAALPPIPPFEDPPIRSAGAPGPEILGGAYRSWTTRVDASDAQVDEIWVGPYHFEGDARSRGGFYVEPHRGIAVGPAVLDVKRGALRLGERTMAKDIEGLVTCNVERFNPDEKPGWEMLRAFSSSALATANAPSLAFLGFFVPEDRVRFEDGGGTTHIALRMENGRLLPRSEVTFETPRVRVSSHGFDVVSDAKLRFHVADDGQTMVDTYSVESRVSRDGVSVPPVSITDSTATFKTVDPDVATGLRFAGLSANLPHIDMPDIRWATGVRPGAHVRFDSGHVTIATKLEVDGALKAHAEATVGIAGAALVVRDALLRATLAATTTVDGEDLSASRKVTIKSGTVTLSRAGVWRGGDMTPIAARVDVDGGELGLEDGFTFKLASHAAVTGSTAVLDLVGAPRIAKFAADILASSRATTYARVGFESGLLTLKLTDGASGAARVNGELRHDEDATEAAFIVYALGVSVGLTVRDGKLGTTIEPGEHWVDENRPTLTTPKRRVALGAEHTAH